MSAGGRLFNQSLAEELAASAQIAIICGRYEGIDDRAIEILGAEEISIGDYVLTGGELAASVIVDAVTRLVPGVIDAASVAEESHHERTARVPAIHAAAGLPGPGGPARSLDRAPRGDPALASRAVAAPHGPPAARPARSARVSPLGSARSWRVSGRLIAGS